MSATLLHRWLAHYDPVHRGWTPEGIANGICTMNGFGFPRIRGGYNLRRVGDGQSAAEMVGAAGATASTVRTFPWVIHSPGASYTYTLTAVNGGGVEDRDRALLTRVAIDGRGDWIGPRPNPPTDLRVTPVRGGRFLLQWVYSEDGQQVQPAEFRLYSGTGWTAVSYGSVAAVVAYRAGQTHISYTSEPFAHGTRVSWAVRAVSLAGAEEDNRRTAMGWADALPPPINPVVIVRCVAEEEECGMES
jgi:hypothetical protein